MKTAIALFLALFVTAWFGPVANAGVYGVEQRPRPCPADLTAPKEGAPSIEQATAYFYCDAEMESNLSADHSILFLADRLTIEIAPSPRKASVHDIFEYRSGPKGHIAVSDQHPVYDIRASVLKTTCHSYRNFSPGERCTSKFTPRSPGLCFRDTFGEWHCRLHRDSWRAEQPVENPGAGKPD